MQQRDLLSMRSKLAGIYLSAEPRSGQRVGLKKLQHYPGDFSPAYGLTGMCPIGAKIFKVIDQIIDFSPFYAVRPDVRPPQQQRSKDFSTCGIVVELFITLDMAIFNTSHSFSRSLQISCFPKVLTGCSPFIGLTIISSRSLGTTFSLMDRF